MWHSFSVSGADVNDNKGMYLTLGWAIIFERTADKMWLPRGELNNFRMENFTRLFEMDFQNYISSSLECQILSNVVFILFKSWSELFWARSTSGRSQTLTKVTDVQLLYLHPHVAPLQTGKYSRTLSGGFMCVCACASAVRKWAVHYFVLWLSQDRLAAIFKLQVLLREQTHIWIYQKWGNIWVMCVCVGERVLYTAHARFN